MQNDKENKILDYNEENWIKKVSRFVKLVLL